MISLQEINKEIEELENSGHTSYAVCEKLANLYIVRDHLMENSKQPMGFVGRVSVGDGDEDTMRMARRMNRDEIEREYSRHMRDIRDRYPDEYEREMNRMRRNYDRY